MSGTHITNVTAGGFTLTGFAGNATFLYDPTDPAFTYLTNPGPTSPSYLFFNSGGTPSYWFNVPIGSSTSDPFIFNTTNPGAPGNYSGPQIVGASGSSSDVWSINVFIQTYYGNPNVGAGKPGDYLYSGTTPSLTGFFIGDSNGNPASETVYGTGDTNLTSMLDSLRLHLAFNSQVSLTFTLIDHGTAGAPLNAEAQWLEFFSACFTAGTRIATPSGETPVENLRIGDLVATSTGVAKPVKWIGRRTYTAAQVAAHPQLRPVLIRRDALGAGMPHRDLVLSPDHSLYCGAALVPVRRLVDGRRIVQEHADSVTYWHVELDQHSVMLAEGMLAESYLDCGDRAGFFGNVCPAPALFAAARREARACALLGRHARAQGFRDVGSW